VKPNKIETYNQNPNQHKIENYGQEQIMTKKQQNTTVKLSPN